MATPVRIPLCPSVPMWLTKHSFTKHLLFHVPVNCFSFPLHLRPLPSSPWVIIPHVPDCLWNPHTYAIKLCWVFSLVNLSHVILTLKPARRTLRGIEYLSLPNTCFGDTWVPWKVCICFFLPPAVLTPRGRGLEGGEARATPMKRGSVYSSGHTVPPLSAHSHGAPGQPPSCPRTASCTPEMASQGGLGV